MGSAPAPPRASALHQSSFRNLRLQFNYRSQMSQLTVTHPTDSGRAFVAATPAKRNSNGGRAQGMSVEEGLGNCFSATIAATGNAAHRATHRETLARPRGYEMLTQSQAARLPGVGKSVNATPAILSDPELVTRLALAEAELRAMKDMLAEVRQSRDDWKAQAERLAVAAPIAVPAPTPSPAVTAAAPEPRRWFGRIGPTRRHVHQARNAEAARKGSIDRRLDDVGSKESEGKSHAGRSFTDALAGGDRLDAVDLAGSYFVEPSPRVGDDKGANLGAAITSRPSTRRPRARSRSPPRPWG